MLLAAVALVPLLPVMLVLALFVKADSKGRVLYCQTRITQYGRDFQIIKFRTMTDDADRKGSLVTVHNDGRITRVGRVLRKYRLDELPQLFNILAGDMSFVGTRPEVPEYVNRYTDEMLATLLLPAGVTSLASIKYKDEETLLADAEHVNDVYVNEVLPGKMKYNLLYLKEFGLLRDLKLMIETVSAVLKDS